MALSIRFYILPAQIVWNERDRCGPKYLKWQFDQNGLDVQWRMKDYGMINVMLIAVQAEAAAHATLAAYADVIAAPENIDLTISQNALPQVVQALESLRIPAGWVTTAHTYRQILRMIGGLFMLAQRHAGMHQEALIDSTAQLNLTWSQIPTARRQRLITTADSLNYDYSEIAATWTVRQILKHLGDQWGTAPIYFGFTTL